MNTENYQRTIIAPKDSLLKGEDVERDHSAVICLQRLEMQTDSWRIAQHCWHSTEWALYLKPFCLRARLKMVKITMIEYSLGILTAKISHIVCSWTAFRNLVSMCLEILSLNKLSNNVSKTYRLIFQLKHKPLKNMQSKTVKCLHQQSLNNVGTRYKSKQFSCMGPSISAGPLWNCGAWPLIQNVI